MVEIKTGHVTLTEQKNSECAARAVNYRITGHVTLAGLREDQRKKLLECSRAVKEAKNDRAKRRKALARLDEAIRYYQACGVLTKRQADDIWYTLNTGI